ncbi:MAG: SDR family NAD(P)-dependent oxidoreductase, partial [Halioglobus sp.]
MSRYNDKVVLITGAASGIGKASAERIASEGGKIVCVDRQREAVEQVAADIIAAGGEAFAIVCDVTDQESVKATVA